MGRHRTVARIGWLIFASACGGRAAVNGAGGSAATGGSGGVSNAGASAGASASARTGAGSGCVGSLEAVSGALGHPCPAASCGASAWALTSCHLWPNVAQASTRSCSSLSAITLTLTDGSMQTCIYTVDRVPIDNGIYPATMDNGQLVGAIATANDPRFCGGVAQTISAGQPLPSDCAASSASEVCVRPLESSGGGTAPGQDSGAPDGCPSSGGGCSPCCPAVTPDCTDKPDGYPGYSCTPALPSAGAYFCACSCQGGKWNCAC